MNADPDRPDVKSEANSSALRYAIAAAAFAGLAQISTTVAGAPAIIELTQVGCQFLEAENSVNHRFQPTSKADCEAINERSGAERLAKSQTLRLKEGEYVFRVVNLDVPYELGFWLRERDYEAVGALRRLTMTSVSGGGLTKGKMKDYKVTLAPGEYLYSCPLNPTPNYHLIVTGK